jgi:tetratricopeptide (TPR) repeat protein
MAVKVRELIERRVPQFVAVYVGGGWGLVQFISFMERWGLSPAWTNITLFAWALFIPSVLLFTWNHGRPGKDAWTRATKIGIPVNILVAVAVLTTAFSGANLGATTHTVTVTDENGEQVERAVPKSAFRKRLALFWFDAPADTSLTWTREGATVALSMDLLQDIFLDVRWPHQFKEKLRDGGVPDGYNVPLSLKQKIAQEMHLAYFVAGSVAKNGNDYVVTTKLYETATSALVKERQVVNADLNAAVDELSVLLRQDMEVPMVRGTTMKDLPVAELMTTNPAAMRAVSQGYAALLKDDWVTADQAMTRAATLDPTFSLAHYIAYQAKIVRGDAQSAITHLARAMQYEHRTPERLHMLVRVETFMMQQQPDQALSVATMMVEYYPDDVLGHQVSAQLYSIRREFDKAIGSLRKVIELDPQQEEFALQIGALQEAKGAFAEALKTYQDYSAKNALDAETLIKIGQVQVILGRLDEAQATFERAMRTAPNKVAPKIQLAMVERSAGNADSAYRRIEHALASATTPDDSLRALSALQTMYEGSGRLREALRVAEQQTKVGSRVMPPLQLIAGQLGTTAVMVRAGQRAQAEATLARFKSMLTAPLDEHWQQGALIIAMETRDTVRINGALPVVRRIMKNFGVQLLESLIVKSEATVLEVRGDWNGALRAYQNLLVLEPGALNLNRDIARCLRNLNRLDEAQQAIDKHLAMSPYGAESNIEAARIKLAQQDAAGARMHLDRAALILAQADAGYAPAAEVKKLLGEIGAR